MNPYQGRDSSAFWSSAVGQAGAWQISGLARPKQLLQRHERIATAGSCFAQHMSRHLRRRGFTFVDAEPAPLLLPSERHREFGFGVYSARYANIYTTTQFRQLIERAYGKHRPADAIWTRRARFFDAFRTQLEPDGFATADEVQADVNSHLRRVRWLFKNTDVFVLTLGLTEAWRSRLDGSVYPIAPGVSDIGSYDAEHYDFINFTFAQVYADLDWSIDFLKRLYPQLRFILTVSPVPLAATASEQHVLAATVYSKSVLRAVAGQLAQEHAYVDYFPAYEIIASPPFRGMFFEPNLRDVSEAGVEHVMRTFAREFCVEPAEPVAGTQAPSAVGTDAVCEERVLDFYAVPAA